MSNIGLNPYEFLGVTLNSTLEEVRKAYHDLALIIHPDKGGSTQDIHILITAYNWIKTQLEYKTNKTYNIIQHEFDEFIKKQHNENPPPLTHLLAETIGFEYDKFTKVYHETLDEYNLTNNKHFEMLHNIEFMYSFIYFSINNRYSKNNQICISSTELWEYVKNELKFYCTSNSPLDYDAKIAASIPHGYENEMEKSTYIDEYKETLKFVYNGLSNECSNVVKECLQFKKGIIKYIEPKSITEFKEIGIPIKLPKELSNYTLHKPLEMTDYKEAFSITSNVNLDDINLKNITVPIDELAKQLEAQRNNLNIV